MTSPVWDRSTVPPGVPLAIVKFEGDVLHPYQDSRGIWTEGAGDTHTPDGQPITAHSSPITAATSLAWLALDEKKYGPVIARIVTVPLTLDQVVPLYSFVHNLGTGRLDGSMIARMLNADKPALAAQQLPGWCYSAGKLELGLLKRRYAEMLMMGGTPLLAAYTTAWAMSLAQLMPSYHKAFSDAHDWGTHPMLAVPVQASTIPRAVIIPTPDEADALDAKYNPGAIS